MRLVMNCYNGMQWCMKENAVQADLKRLADKRKRQGFDIEWLNPMSIEVNSDGLISDYMGVAQLVSDNTRLIEAGE